MEQKNVEQKNVQAGSSIEFTEYYKLELQEVYTRINSADTFRIQLGTFFGTASLTVVGIAITAQKAGLFFIAAIILVFLVIMDRHARRSIAILYYRGLVLQKMFAPDDKETYLHILPGQLLGEVIKISEIQDPEKRLVSLHKVSRSVPSFYGFWVPLIVILLEVSAGLGLWLVFQWSLF